MKYSSLLLDLTIRSEIMPSTMDIASVTKSREEKTTSGMDSILPVVIFSCKVYIRGKFPATKIANEIIPKEFNGFTFINIKRSVFPILIPSP
jgi:hypothetical protein